MSVIVYINNLTIHFSQQCQYYIGVYKSYRSFPNVSHNYAVHKSFGNCVVFSYNIVLQKLIKGNYVQIKLDYCQHYGGGGGTLYIDLEFLGNSKKDKNSNCNIDKLT